MENLDSSVNFPGPTLPPAVFTAHCRISRFQCLALSTEKGEREVLVLMLLFENSLTLSNTLHVSETPFLWWSNVRSFSASL